MSALVRQLDGVRQGDSELPVSPVVRGTRGEAVEGTRPTDLIYRCAFRRLLHRVRELPGDSLEHPDVSWRPDGPAPRVQDGLAEAVEGDEEVDVTNLPHHSLQALRLRLTEGVRPLVRLAAGVRRGTDAPLEVPVTVQVDSLAAAVVGASVLAPQPEECVERLGAWSE